MSVKNLQNVAASVRQRLYNLARQRGEDFQFVLTRFGLERLLYRLSTSPYAGKFLLKGAMLFAVWSDQIHRPTLDLDLAGRGESSLEQLERMFRELCAGAGAEDGLTFDPDSVTAGRIREAQQYPGARVHLTAYLDSARILLQVDVGYGDAVTPAPALIEYPTLLGHSVPRLKAYPQETVIAEKLQAMVFLGMANTRMKDFYDLWILAWSFEYSGNVLSRAIQATFERRQTVVPSQVPLALTTEFFEDAGKQKAWTAFLGRSKLSGAPASLPEVCGLLEQFLTPPSRAAANGEAFDLHWQRSGPWK